MCRNGGYIHGNTKTVVVASVGGNDQDKNRPSAIPPRQRH